MLRRARASDTIVAVGAPDIPANDLSAPALAGTFCVVLVADSALNATKGLPGIGRVVLRGELRGLP